MFQIGLMRDGKILIEENPEKLLIMYNCESLEDVYLILSKNQEFAKNHLTVGEIEEGEHAGNVGDTTQSQLSISSRETTEAFDECNASTDVSRFLFYVKVCSN